MAEYRVISRALLNEPPQPVRMTMDDEKLQELADSIKEFGLMLPLVVTPDGEHFEIVDGHRRFLASGLAALAAVPCMIFPNVEDAKYGMMLHANIMREDITAAEEGVQFLELAEKRGWSEPQLCKFFGCSANYINDRARLVTDFPDVMPYVAKREINWTQARAIMKCPDKAWRAYCIDQCVTHGASARTIVNIVDQWKTQQLLAGGRPASHTPEHVVIAALPPAPECIWCQRADEPNQIVVLHCHSYHVRDLREFLRRVGIHTSPASGGNGNG